MCCGALLVLGLWEIESRLEWVVVVVVVMLGGRNWRYGGRMLRFACADYQRAKWVECFIVMSNKQ